MIKLFCMNENVVQYFYNKAFKNFYIEENSKKILRNIFKKMLLKYSITLLLMTTLINSQAPVTSNIILVIMDLASKS
jgi:hypothetical protein